MNWRAFNRLSLYLVIAGCTFALANLKETMTPYQSQIFLIGMLLNLAVTIRTFLDSSTSTKPEALPPPAVSPAPEPNPNVSKEP